MGSNEKCSWDDNKRRLNIAHKGYDFADVEAVFDGRFCLTRLDTRKDYGELRHNMLVVFRERVINLHSRPGPAKSI